MSLACARATPAASAQLSIGVRLHDGVDSLTDKRTADNLRMLNRSFWSETWEPKALVDAMLKHGYNSGNCVLLELFPDSGSTWLVRLMSNECELYELDVDLSDPATESVERMGPDAFRTRQGRILLNQARELVQER